MSHFSSNRLLRLQGIFLIVLLSLVVLKSVLDRSNQDFNVARTSYQASVIELQQLMSQRMHEVAKDPTFLRNLDWGYQNSTESTVASAVRLAELDQLELFQISNSNDTKTSEPKT